MNHVKKGYFRDRQIIELVEKHKALSTEQIAVMLFHEIKSGPRKARDRLQKLAKRKQLSRTRLSIDQPYIYYTGKQPAQIEHRVALNWALIWLIRTMANWERTIDWEYEPDYGYVRPDLLWIAENTVTKRYRAVYVELDRSDRNKWDKTQKYNKLFEEEGYAGAEWVEHTDRFPRILVATTTEARAKQIRADIEAKNRNDLRFDVRLQSELKGEIWPWAKA